MRKLQAREMASSLKYPPKEKLPSISKKVWCLGVNPTLSRSLCFPDQQRWMRGREIQAGNGSQVCKEQCSPPALMQFWTVAADLKGGISFPRK